MLLEVQLFTADPSRHNAGRVATACQHHGAIGVAATIDVALQEVQQS